jgi:hypothetical protein
MTIVLNQPDSLEVTIIIEDSITCKGNSDGSLEANITGGVAPYQTYTWQKFGDTWDNISYFSNVNNLSAGTYRLTVTDKNGNTTTSPSFVLTEPDVLTISDFEYTNPSCYGYFNGSAAVTVTGGTLPYVYSWEHDYVSTGTNLDTISGLSIGDLSVSITDAKNCPAVDQSVELVEPAQLTAMSAIDLPSAYNASNGKITIAPSGGTAPYTYLWDDNSTTTNPLTGIPARDNPYTVIVTDANNCAIVLDDLYVIYYPMEINIVVDNAILCYEGVGTLSATVTGGTTSKTYQWSQKNNGSYVNISGKTSATLAGIVAGEYRLTATDSRNSIVSKDFELVQPTQLTATSVIDLPSAYNASDGEITIAPSGGVAPYSYKWDYDNSTANSLTGIPASDTPYKVTVTDNNQCVIERSPRMIYELAVTIGTTNSILCYDGTETLQATATGGVGTNYSYQWYKITDANKTQCGTGATLPGAIAGKYSVTVTDEESNEAESDDFDFGQPAQLTATTVIDLPSAYNASDGKITIAPSGGTPTYTYKWNYNNSTANPLVGIPARDEVYTVTVTDANGCTKIIDDISVVYYPIVATITVDKAVSCNGGSDGILRVATTGGTSVKYYQWAKKNKTTDIFADISNAQTNVLSNIGEGIYRVQVKDNRDTVIFKDIELTQPDLLTAKDSIVSPSAHNLSDGKIIITPNGGVAPYSYLWDDNSVANPLTGVSARSEPYKVTVTDANGCTKTIDDINVVYYPMEVNIIESAAIACYGGNGTLTAVATGGSAKNYQWYYLKDDGNSFEALMGKTSATLSDIVTGTYRVRIKDSNDTTKFQQYEITQPDSLTAVHTLILPKAYNASDGKITIAPSGGTAPYSYLWEHNNSTANPLDGIPAKDEPYKVTVTDANGCTKKLSVRVIYPLSVTIAVSDSISCYAGTGSLQATATGGVGAGYSYEWYKIDEDYFNVEDLIPGETNKNLGGIFTGKYRAKVTDVEGNTEQSGIVSLLQPDLLKAKDSVVLPSVYNASDGKIIIATNGGTVPYSYKWEHDNSTTNPLTGIPARDNPYKVKVTDAKGCYVELETEVIYPLAVEIAIVDSIACYGGAGALKAIATGGVGVDYSYGWYRVNGGTTQLLSSSKEAVLAGLTTGTYRVEAIDKRNNTKPSGDFVLAQPPLLTARDSVVLPSVYNASDGKIIIAPSGGTAPYSYLWEHDNSTTNPLTGIPARDNPYKVTVTDAKGCSKTLDDIRVVYYPMAVEIVSYKPVSCFGESDGKLRATATGGISANRSYKWYKIVNGYETIVAEGSSDSLTNRDNGIYRVKVTDKSDSTVISEDYELFQPDSLTAVYDISLPSAYNASDGAIEITASGGTVPYSYKWDYNNSTVNPLAGLPANDNPYAVTISDSRGCVKTLNPRIIYPLSVEIGIKDSISCYLSSNGALTATATGGVGTDYSYKWYKTVYGQNELISVAGNMLQDIGDGIYYVEVTDKEGNKIASEPLLFNQPGQLKIDYEVTLTSSADATDGMIEVTVNGGTLPYSYAWNYNNNITDKLTGLSSGQTVYKLTVSDRRFCRDSISTRLVYPLKVNISVEDSISCFGNADGRLKANASGGLSKDYSYQWYKLDKGTEMPIADATADELTNAGAGIYRVRVTGLEDMSAVADLTFDSPDLLAVTSKIDLPSAYDAGDGAIKLTVKGGTPAYLYSWGNNYDADDLLSGVPANDNPYAVTVSDRRGCSETLYPRIIYPLEVEILVIDSISCYGRADGQLKAIATGGVGTNYSYQWYEIENGTDKLLSATSENLLQNIGEGTYKIKVVDVEDNISYATLIFNQPALLEVDAEYLRKTLRCKFDTDGSVNLYAKGGTVPYSYLWQDESVAALNSSLPEGVHSFTVTDKRGCSYADTVEIASPDELLVDIHHLAPKAYNSSDASVWVEASGGTSPYKYSWEGRSETTSQVGDITYGIYTATVTDANGCTKKITDTIPNPPLLKAFVAATKTVSCNGYSNGSLTATSEGGVGVHRYVWYQVEENNLRQLDSTQDIDSLPAGAYRVRVIDDNDITAYSGDFELTEPATLTVSVKTNGTSCSIIGDSWVEAAASGGTAPYSYLWTSGHQSAHVDGLESNKYLVFVTDARGCETKGSVEVKTAPKLLVDISFTQPECANDGALHLNVKGGIAPYTYLWNDGLDGSSRTGLSFGDYNVSIREANGCLHSIYMILNEPKPANINLGGNVTLCKEQQTEFNVTNSDVDTQYQWYRNDKPFASTPVVTISESGLYSVESVTSKGCRSEGMVNVSFLDNIIEADFTVATKAVRREITKLVNISYPTPEHFEWIIPEDPDIEIIDTTNEYAELIFRENGSYTIGMTSFVGVCSKTVYKEVLVLEKYDIPEYEPEKDAFLKSFIAYPNPSSGQFTVKIELGAEADVRLRLIDITGNVIDDREAKGSDSYEIYYNINNAQGIYILQLTSEKANTSLKLLLNSY